MRGTGKPCATTQRDGAGGWMVDECTVTANRVTSDGALSGRDRVQLDVLAKPSYPSALSGWVTAKGHVTIPEALRDRGEMEDGKGQMAGKAPVRRARPEMAFGPRGARASRPFSAARAPSVSAHGRPAGHRPPASRCGAPPLRAARRRLARLALPYQSLGEVARSPRPRHPPSGSRKAP